MANGGAGLALRPPSPPWKERAIAEPAPEVSPGSDLEPSDEEDSELSVDESQVSRNAFTVVLSRPCVGHAGEAMLCGRGAGALGLSIRCYEGSLIVDKVMGGAAKAWNFANPEAQLRPGDEIIEVNGVRGDASRLLEECASSSDWKMKLARTDVGCWRPRRSSSDLLSWRSGELLARTASNSLQKASSLVGLDLLDAAMDTLVDPSEAMHPERAYRGLELLRSTTEDLITDRKSSHSPPRPITRMRSCFLCFMQDSNMDRAAVERLFFDSMPRRHVRIDSVETVINPGLLKRFLERVTKEEACVEATFHGTRQEASEAILRNGLVPDKNGIAAYGHGVYVGTHAGVAHQYATPDDSGRRFMCVVLVVVGSRVVKGAQGANSTVTQLDRLVNPTQYCVVDSDRLLVSHLITYRVVGGQPRRIGGGFDDPFQRRLSRAVERSGRTRQRRGFR